MKEQWTVCEIHVHVPILESHIIIENKASATPAALL